jgi:predicted nucleic acid-binding protein
VRKYVVDTNCYIDASRDPGELASLSSFASRSAPGLFLSSVVAAELRAGVRTAAQRKKLEKEVLGPFVRRGRIFTPSSATWDALGLALATFREEDGLQLASVRRSFAFDILVAYSCRENGAMLVTRNSKDMERIRRVFAFDHVLPYPEPP